VGRKILEISIFLLNKTLFFSKRAMNTLKIKYNLLFLSNTLEVFLKNLIKK
jgi:hypothetical protein